MTPPDPRLLGYLQTPAAAALSDAAAATATQQPIYTPRTQPITVTTLSSSAVWGFPKTSACQAAYQAVVSAGGSNGAAAQTLLGILNGPGFDATDPQVQSLSGTFVTLAGGVITSQDATNALNTVSYIAGQPWQASDVTAARAYMADQAARASIVTALAATLNQWLPQLATAPNAAAVVAQVQAALTAAGVN